VGPVYATHSLAEVLCELAADTDPSDLSVRLAATPADDLEPATGDAPALDPDQPVLSDFYFPDAGGALTNVFGMDLATPTGQTAGRFVSHPDGRYDVSITDDLHARLLVAVPPWEPDAVRAYDRSGNRRDLVLVDATAPAGDLPE
jgi:hypothetical protein